MKSGLLKPNRFQSPKTLMERSAAVQNATPTIPQLLGVLHHDLEVAGVTYRQGGEQDARQCAELALGKVLYFLQNVYDRESPALLPLQRLLYALDDLGRGQVDPLLQPTKINNRPPNPLREEVVIAFAAAAMELFIDNGMPRKDAAQRVAHALNSSHYRIGKANRVTPKHVEKWRDRMRAGLCSDNEAVGRFGRLIEQGHSLFPSPRAAADQILRRLPLVAPPEIPLKGGA